MPIRTPGIIPGTQLDRHHHERTLHEYKTDVLRMWQRSREREDPNAFRPPFGNIVGRPPATYCFTPSADPTADVWRVTFTGFTGTCTMWNASFDCVWHDSTMETGSSTMSYNYRSPHGSGASLYWVDFTIFSTWSTANPGTMLLHNDSAGGLDEYFLYSIPGVCSGSWARNTDATRRCTTSIGSVSSVVRL